MGKPSRVLIVGGTGYMGKRMVMASLALGHPTFVLVRPDQIASNIHKAQLVISFKQAGAHLIQGSVDDHESIVNALKQVDVVVSTIAESHILEQLKLIKAIKEVGTIKRFLPSEFGMDVDRMHHVMEPGNLLFEQKRQVRRATEAARIPYTYVSANCFAGYFLAGLAQYGRFIPPTDKVFIYGEGTRKGILLNSIPIVLFESVFIYGEGTRKVILVISESLSPDERMSCNGTVKSILIYKGYNFAWPHIHLGSIRENIEIIAKFNLSFNLTQVRIS